MVQAASAHGVEDVKVAGLYTSRCGGQVGVWGVGWAGWTASDAVPTSWTQYLQRSWGEGKGSVKAQVGLSV